MERDSFVYYRSFWEATKDLPRDVVYEVDQAIKDYALNGVERQDLKPVAKALFAAFKPQIDANNKRFVNGCKGGQYGHLGGRPRKNREEEKPQENPKETPKKPQENPKITPNVNDNVNVNEINKEIEDKSSIKKERNSESIFDSSMLPPIPPPPSPEEVKKEPTKRFIPPTLEEVKAYIKEKGYTFSAEAFVGFYESNGWMVGKNKMKNWHGACATWQSKRNEEKPQSLATQVMRNKRYTQYKPQSNGTDTRPLSESDNELW